MKLLKLELVLVKSLRFFFIFIFCHALMEFLLWKAMLAIFKWSENDRWSWLWVIVDTFPPDFQTMMVSDCRSWFGKMIVSDHRSRKKGLSPTRPLHYLSTYLLFWILNISHCLSTYSFQTSVQSWPKPLPCSFSNHYQRPRNNQRKTKRLV